ncbi:MAG: hypothetical protein HUU27_03195 [Phycisphaerae bacterium]|nr:hypothetical protein [Phycisphaerae bacterium]
MESMLPRAARVALRLAVTTVAAMLASGHVARAAPAAAQDRLAPEQRGDVIGGSLERCLVTQESGAAGDDEERCQRDPLGPRSLRDTRRIAPRGLEQPSRHDGCG